jgi:HEAT repeat protein
MNIELLIEALHTADEQNRACAAEQLAASGDERAIAALVDAIRRVETDCDVGLWAAERALASFGERGFYTIIEHTYEQNAFNRSLFVSALRFFENEQALHRLIDLLDDPDDFVRLRVSETLAQIGKGRFLSLLLPLIDDRQRPAKARVAVILALYHIRDAQAIDPLLRALRDRQGWVRASAAFALGAFYDERLIAPLIQATHDRVAFVRSAAVGSLAKYVNTDDRVRRTLGNLQQDQNREVRVAVSRALETERSET